MEHAPREGVRTAACVLLGAACVGVAELFYQGCDAVDKQLLAEHFDHLGYQVFKWKRASLGLHVLHEVFRAAELFC